MRAVVQRVTGASVKVGAEVVGSIGRGMVVFLGVAEGDGREAAARLARKVAALRVFDDAAGRMNLSCAEAGGEVLCVSQFTLFGDVRRGNRPSFTGAAAPEVAEPLYEAFREAVEREGLRCARGVFGAEMTVEAVNDGPVTLIVDTVEMERPRRS